MAAKAPVWPIGMALAVMVLAGWNSAPLASQVNPPVRPEGLDAQDSSAAVSLLGQFRTSISAWLYLHADVYLHNGVEMRPLTRGEINAGREGVGGSDADDPLHNDERIVTVIPAPDRDFRGVIGDLERSVSAYRDMHGHSHNDPTIAIPLFRLMTTLDPSFIPGWTIGAATIARDRNIRSARAAMAYVREGVAANPNSLELHGAVGKLYLTAFARSQPDGKLLRPIALALPWYERAAELAWAHREHLSDTEREAALENARFYAFCLRDSGDRARLRSSLQQSLSLFPDDAILRRLQSQAAAAR